MEQHPGSGTSAVAIEKPLCLVRYQGIWNLLTNCPEVLIYVAVRSRAPVGPVPRAIVRQADVTVDASVDLL